MVEAYGDLWNHPAKWKIVTTNGYVSRNGRAAMSAGCALEAVDRFPSLARLVGERLNLEGNHVFTFPLQKLLTFPVKKHWRDDADIELIQQSVRELLRVLDTASTYVMPRAGCGYGRLQWEQVRPYLQKLPDNVTVIHFSPTSGPIRTYSCGGLQ